MSRSGFCLFVYFDMSSSSGVSWVLVVLLGIKLWAFGKLSTVALSDSVKPIYFFIVLANFFDYASSCCISSLEIKVLLEDWSGIFELTVLYKEN